jgi:CPA2 family monovalent cation:H+ antiporter-2
MEVSLLQLGTIIFLAFAGALIAHRLGHSLMIAYIVVGLLVGPFGPLPWKLATASDVEGGFIAIVAKIGLVMLMFFVGLEFYPSKLRESGSRAAILAATDIAITMFIGFAVCTFLGMSLVDTIFMASIIAMSSVAVTMKALEELGWQNTRATEALVGMMIIEDFAFIILLTLGNGLLYDSGAGGGSILVVLASIATFLVFFVVLIFVFVPNVLSHIERVEHEELFILLALATVLLSGALAEEFGLSAFIGAFFMGVAFAETKLAPRLKAKTVSFRDAFAAIFFVSFGMMINPSGIVDALPIIALVVPLVLAGEVLVCAIVAYIVGLGAEDAMTVGGGTTARSEEAIIFANMGGSLRTADDQSYVLSQKVRSTLFPFTGVFCLVMSSVTPILIGRSRAMAAWLRDTVPSWLKASGAAISRTVCGILDEGGNGSMGFVAGGILAYSVFMVALSPTLGTLADTPQLASAVWLCLAGGILVTTLAFWWSLRRAAPNDGLAVGILTALVLGAQATILLWQLSYVYSLAVAATLLMYMLTASWRFGTKATASDT